MGTTNHDASMNHAAPEISIEEVSPRDGLQNESVILSVEDRATLVDRLVACGLRRIQIGSFVNPGRVPQMAGTEDVYRLIRHRPDVIYSALILNRRGLDRARDCGITHVSLFVSASEAHSRRNAQCSVNQALASGRELIGDARAMGITIQAGVMNAFGCRFEGNVPMVRVLEMVRIFEAEGADEINLADTSGLAHPAQVETMVSAVKSITDLPLALHLHDTFGFGLVNAYAAWNAGVRRFDAGCGGLGGCPFIPGVAGNIPTEDLAWLFESMGVSTGVDLKRVVRMVSELEERVGRRLPGRLAHADFSGFLDKCHGQ